MTRTAIAYLAEDPSKSKQAEFKRVALRLAAAFGAPPPVPIVTGADLVEVASGLDYRSCDRLVVVCHGGPDWLVNSRRGVHATRGEAPGVGRVSAARLAEALAPAMVPGGLVALAACLCARSPRWWLREAGEYTGNDWGPHAYRDGGARSFAATLRDELARRGAPVRVRGHGTVGHVTGNPILREFPPVVGVEGRSLFGLALPGVEPTAARRRRWIDLVKGEVAEAWLLGDDEIPGRIARAWAAV